MMNRPKVAAACVIACLGLAVACQASPTRVHVVDTVEQDPLSPLDWVHELVDNSSVPDDERIHTQWSPLGEPTIIPCPAEYDDQGPPNRMIRITNLTGKSWPALYYVADSNTNLTNYDGLIGDNTGGVQATPEKAFRIDNIGLNQPLFAESMSADLIFEPNESWDIVLQNYSDPCGIKPALMGSVGVASASAGCSLSTGSIITPEPTTIGLLALGSPALTALRRRRK